MKMIDVSVIIPVYNVEAYVEACLRSVMEQAHSGFNVECIIVDDRGQDGSMDVVRRTLDTYKGDIEFKIIEHDENHGLSAARNTAIRASCGKYVTFLDSDDRLLPGALAGMYQLTVKYPGVDIVQGNTRLNKENEYLRSALEISPARLPEFIPNSSEAKHLLLFDMPVIACAKLIRRDFITSNNIYYTEGMVHEDDMWDICASRYIRTLAFYFSYVYYYNNDIENSITQKSDKTRSLLGRIALIPRAAECYEQEPCIDYYDYLMRRLDFVNKSELWASVRDRKIVRKAISKMRKNIAKSNCPLPIRLAALYFTLPNLIGSNRFILPAFRRFSGLLKRYYIRKLKK